MEFVPSSPAWSAAMVSFALSACEGETSTLPREEFSQRFLETLVDIDSRCCPRVPNEACEALVTEAIRANIDDTREARYDGRRAGACIRALVATSENCRLEQRETASLDVCEHIFAGIVEEGMECATDLECAPIGGKDAVCNLDADAVRSICLQNPLPDAADALEPLCTRDTDCPDGHCTSDGICANGEPPRALCVLRGVTFPATPECQTSF